MLAVKLVVHGLVEFIQNFSKKNHDTPQVWEKKRRNGQTDASLGLQKFLCFSLGSRSPPPLCLSASAQQQVQDQHVPRPPPAGRLSSREQLHLRAHAGRAGEVSQRRRLARLLHPPLLLSSLITPQFQIQAEEQEERRRRRPRLSPGAGGDG